MLMNGDRMLAVWPPRPGPIERGWRTNGPEVAPSCPRCASPNTKFCYYNNYSLSQPRYFCKSCRRYWTKGGTLRNVPVGGGCRKSRRNSRSAPATSSSSSRYSKDPLGSDLSGSGHGSSRNSSGESTIQPVNGAGGSSEIDLALVFAKFLNQSPTYDPERPGLDSSPSGHGHAESCDYNPSALDPNSAQNGLLVEEIQEDWLTVEGLQGERVEEYLLGPDPCTFGFPFLAGGEAEAANDNREILWSSDDPNYSNCLSNFAWQEQISTNPASENWSNFDLSGL